MRADSAWSGPCTAYTFKLHPSISPHSLPPSPSLPPSSLSLPPSPSLPPSLSLPPSFFPLPPQSCLLGYEEVLPSLEVQHQNILDRVLAGIQCGGSVTVHAHRQHNHHIVHCVEERGSLTQSVCFSLPPSSLHG